MECSNEVRKAAATGDRVEDGSELSCSSSEFHTSDTNGNEDHRSGCLFSFPSPSTQWSSDLKPQISQYSGPDYIDNFEESQLSLVEEDDLAEMDLVRERLSKLLLGEDMSGTGNGVSTALAISNAITNLSASVFGQLWRLEPLPQIKKSMWRREMECLLCVTDYIAELKHSWNSYPDGSRVEVASCIPRADLSVNLPALRKLDNMLLEILDSFDDTSFWYEEHGLASPDTEVLSSFRKGLRRQEEKWWLPVPQVPPSGLSDDIRKKLQNKRESANQILKAATAINHNTLAEMEIPQSYLEGLPKHGRACIGDKMYRYMTSHNFSPESVLEGTFITSENQALEMANRLEAAISLWHRRKNSKDTKRSNNQRSNPRHSWDLVKDHVLKRELLADRAERFLLCLKQRFPGLFQTSLDTSKIQYNKDVGKSILESYSRVLESLAFSIMARVDDIFHVDDRNKQSDQTSKMYIPKVCSFRHRTISLIMPNVRVQNFL